MKKPERPPKVKAPNCIDGYDLEPKQMPILFWVFIALLAFIATALICFGVKA